jgi:hypothetical protein
LADLPHRTETYISLSETHDTNVHSLGSFAAVEEPPGREAGQREAFYKVGDAKLAVWEFYLRDDWIEEAS